MPSPFPGMNPYLEQGDVWQDFHDRFIPAVAEVLGTQTDPRYIVKIGEHLYVHELSEQSRRFFGRADVSVAPADSETESGGIVALEAPARVLLPAVDVERVPYIEILDRRSRELVTVVELLSPTNKRPGADREQYLAKHAQLLASSVHFVEIDLLRGGKRMPMDDPPDSEYCVLVSRSEELPEAGLWPIRLEDGLPAIPVPLRAPDPDAHVELQDVLNRVYDAARYHTYLYDDEPNPPLSPEQRDWARAFLPAS